MQFDIMENEFLRKMEDALTFMADHEPPYLIHCVAGIDRTGFLSILLESFMGAKFDDIVKDYMLSFVDGDDYSISDYKSGSTFLTNLFSRIKGGMIDSNDEPQLLAVKYLKEKIGIDGEVLALLRNKLSAGSMMLS